MAETSLHSIIVLSLYPLHQTGGGERWTLDSATALLEAGFPCEIYAPANVSFIGQGFSERISSSWHRWTLADNTWSSSSLPYTQLLDIVHSFDAVIIHQYLSNDAFFDFYLNLSPDQPVFVINQGHIGNSEKFAYLSPSGGPLTGIGVSEFACTLDRRFGIESSPLYAGLWRKDFSEIASVAGIKQKKGCLSLGRILPHKGFETAIQALLPREELTIIGPASDPDYLNYLRKIGGLKKITWAGLLNEAQKKSLLSSSRLLIAGSTDSPHHGEKCAYPELLGLVILEALAANTLVLASDLPPFVEIMEVLHLGDFIFKRNDPADLRKVMDRALSLDPARYLEYLKTGRQLLLEHFLWDDFSTRFQQRLSGLPQVPAIPVPL